MWRVDLKFFHKDFAMKSMKLMVRLALHPHRIAPTFLKLDSWLPGVRFIFIKSTKGINQIKNGKF